MKLYIWLAKCEMDVIEKSAKASDLINSLNMLQRQKQQKPFPWQHIALSFWNESISIIITVSTNIFTNNSWITWHCFSKTERYNAHPWEKEKSWKKWGFHTMVQSSTVWSSLIQFQCFPKTKQKWWNKVNSCKCLLVLIWGWGVEGSLIDDSTYIWHSWPVLLSISPP